MNNCKLGLAPRKLDENDETNKVLRIVLYGKEKGKVIHTLLVPEWVDIENIGSIGLADKEKNIGFKFDIKENDLIVYNNSAWE